MKEHFFRIRISTVLVFCGLVFLPWSTYWLPRPVDFASQVFFGKIFDFVAYDFAPQLIFLGIFVALLNIFWFAYIRKWIAIPQLLIELCVGFGAAIILPAY